MAEVSLVNFPFRFDYDIKVKYIYILTIITRDVGKLKMHS